MFNPDDPFVKYLTARKGRRVYLKPYVGNSGDELIWMGNEVLLKELGMSRVVDPRRAEVILWPGGNPAMWQGHLDGWQDSWRLFPDAEFTIAPATFQGEVIDWRTPLKTTRARIGGVFARDEKSFHSLQALGLSENIEIGLGHDPALHLLDSDWVAMHREAATSEYILVSLRGDHESIFAPPHPGGLAKRWPFSSLLFRQQMRRQKKFGEKLQAEIRQQSGTTPALVCCDAPLMSFQSFVETVRRATQVHTDRLHCMILAALLGKEVHAYPTAYAKLEGVYEHSLKSWAKIHFVRG